MICRSCRTASTLLREQEVIHQYLDGRPQQLLSGQDAAREMHKGCKGGTWCDCQHSVPAQVPRGT